MGGAFAGRIDFAGSMAIFRANSETLAARSAHSRAYAPPSHGEPQLITPAFAQGSLGGSGDMILQLVPFLLIFVIMWFLIIRPQQRRAKEHAEMVRNVRRGDIVVTTGGIVGKVTKVTDDPEIEVEIAEGVRVKLVRGMIAEVRSKGEPVKA